MVKMRTLLVTDIHGSFRALTQVLERAKFNPEEDLLISLGDVCDGWPDVTECVDYLQKLPNHKHLLGNHDSWCHTWLKQNLGRGGWGLNFWDFIDWDDQGGRVTRESIDSAASHALVCDYLDKAAAYLELGDDLLVHGGIRVDSKAEDNDVEYIIWDRNMIAKAVMAGPIESPVVEFYRNVYCGHTPTTKLRIGGGTEPVKHSNVWLLDTGASYDGALTVFCKETEEFWQSDPVVDLYPGIKAR